MLNETLAFNMPYMGKPLIMQSQSNENNSHYQNANDRATHMTDMDKNVSELEQQGYTDQFQLEKGKLLNLATNKKYVPKDIKAVNFYRYEGISDPDDMSVLYAIETCDGRKGTLVDAYGLYSDDDIGAFMKEVEINKKTS
jgi:hypothetical protein